MTRTVILTPEGPKSTANGDVLEEIPVETGRWNTMFGRVTWRIPEGCCAIVFLEKGTRTGSTSTYDLHGDDVFVVTNGGSRKWMNRNLWERVARGRIGKVYFEFCYVLFSRDDNGCWVMHPYCSDGCITINAGGEPGHTAAFDFTYDPQLGNRVDSYSNLLREIDDAKTQGSQSASYDGFIWSSVLTALVDRGLPRSVFITKAIVNKPRIIVRR